MKRFIAEFRKDERGVTAIEYSLIAAMIAVAIVGVLGDVGKHLDSTFRVISDELANADPKAP